MSDHQIVSRRLILAAAGLSVLGAAGCGGARWAGEPGTAPRGNAGPPPAAAPPAAAPEAAPETAPEAAPEAVPEAPRVLTEAESRPLFELAEEGKVVALTIDDGPHPRHTPDVLALLEKHGIRATFFLIGENAAARPDLVREIAARGHRIGNHTWSHPDLRHLPDDAQVRDELTRTSDLLAGITGKSPAWFRAPGGDWAPRTLRTSRELGMRPMGWTVDPEDWAEPGTEVILGRLTKEMRPGAIVLTHDGGGDRSQTVAALARFLPSLIDSGYRFTTPRA